VIAVHSPVQLSHFLAVGDNLSGVRCPNNNLAGVLLSHVPQVLSERRCLSIAARVSRLKNGTFAAPSTVIRSCAASSSHRTPRWRRRDSNPPVKSSLEAVPGVAEAVVSYTDKTAVVTFDDAKTAVPALIIATTNAGYPSALKS